LGLVWDTKFCVREGTERRGGGRRAEAKAELLSKFGFASAVGNLRSALCGIQMAQDYETSSDAPKGSFFCQAQGYNQDPPCGWRPLKGCGDQGNQSLVEGAHQKVMLPSPS
jgi:hypothetical protein